MNERTDQPGLLFCNNLLGTVFFGIRPTCCCHSSFCRLLFSRAEVCFSDNTIKVIKLPVDTLNLWMSRVVDRKNTVCRGDSKPKCVDTVSPRSGEE